MIALAWPSVLPAGGQAEGKGEDIEEAGKAIARQRRSLVIMHMLCLRAKGEKKTFGKARRQGVAKRLEPTNMRS